MTKQEIYDKWWMHSKPVARSLEILDQKGMIEYIEGRTDNTTSFLPFTVKIKGGTFLCKPTELHAFVAAISGNGEVI